MRAALAVAMTSFLALSPGAPARAQEAHPVFPSAPRVERLPNGLTVVTLPWNSPGIIAYYTLVRVGSRDEVEPGHSGFAHLFEHMMFRGTERFPEQVYEETMQSFGADGNAYTSDDLTLYVITAPSTALTRLVELEADRFQRLSYDEEQFRTETGAVLGEYNKSSSDPLERMWEVLSESAFRRHTYGHTTIGYLRDICAMPEMLDYSRSFFRRYYTPDNITIFVVGDFERDALMEQIRAQYGAWRGRRDRPRIPVEPEPTEGVTRHIPWAGASPPRMLVGYRTPGFDGGARNARARVQAFRQSAALQVVHGLAFADSAPLYQRLVVQEQRLLRLSSWDEERSRDPHLFLINAVLKPGTPFEPVLRDIQAELGRIASGAVPAERVEAVRSHIRYAMIAGLETPADAAELMARFMAVGGEVTTLTDYMAALSAVTPEDVAGAAARFLTERRRFVVTLAPAGEGETVPEPQTCDSVRGES